MRKRRYYIPREKCGCGLSAFYKNAAKIAGLPVTERTLYDCRRICTTQAVHDTIWAYYAQEGCEKLQITMLMLLSGPKANLSGDRLEFEIEEGFTCEE